MSEPRRSHRRRERPRAAPVGLDEALTRGARHARAAAAEALGLLGALVEAASLLASQRRPAAGRRLAPLSALLEELAARLAGAGDGRLLAALAEALDAEVARWEARARSDLHARAVLRAFLALRDLLFELGVRREPARTGAEPPAPARPRPVPARPRRRVQRVPVEG